MRDRLIELLEGAEAKASEYIKENDQMDFIPTLKELLGVYADHLLAEGVIVLPCSIGQTVYHITTCEGFEHELDGSLYDSFGGLGDATGYYCPCELRDNCPFDNEEDFDCDTLKKKQAVFEDEVKGFMLGDCEWDNVVFLKYSGNVYFHEFGKTVFLTREEAERALERSKNGT